jgi:pyroglutamyl-peptidase
VVSNTAGTYVCNHIVYQVLYMIDREFSGKRGGFVHVPYAPQQVVDRPGEPALAIDDMANALAAALGAIVEYRDKPDERSVGGVMH